ncbi:signal peptidase II [Desulfurobacterium atlanticum]|uniref:Lipoprotein signal peptidase n=1 Tax=Desulfurobacterium atlanticum TaxID=240169 RepID=A0A238YMB1_9BACT|nr:signal peptidase II [Desulfurobacterium atlanticum]SNR71928.1 signal peptidase II [Desulfurobacterium atlanticum]
MLVFLVAVFVFVLDRMTKLLALKYLKGNVIEVVPGFFRLIYAENKGAAFSLFSSFSGIGRFVFLILVPLIVIAGIIYVLIYRKELSFIERISFSLILGGAAGNLYDRVVYGKVIDFLDFYIGKYHWPAFNVADIAVFLGTVALFLYYFLKSSREDNVIQ